MTGVRPIVKVLSSSILIRMKEVAAKKATGSAATKAKKPTAPPSHPPTQQMVDASIKNLKERGGSSLLAIKKYITATYKCDAQKLAPFIKKYLKSAVVNGKLIQTKGKGASGSFKLSASAKKDPKPKVASVDKKVKSKKVAVKKTGVTAKKAAGAADKKPKAKKAVATKKTAEKKKTEKAKAKDAKKTGTVKAKPAATKAKTTAAKPKVAKAPKAKPAASAKPKKVIKKAAAPATAKKPKAKTTAAKK
ncbi:histone H1-like [Drosophila elegans]|uniref:histone H1-like n=1 Tax=Drosophila elegans TaxID=30023 RepID=UPI001BC82F8B|nr:histone H1-like [Drosophila elegans]